MELQKSHKTESDDQTEKPTDACDNPAGSLHIRILINKKSKIWQAEADAYIFDKMTSYKIRYMT